MTHNSLFPGFVKIRYSGLTFTHVQTLPVMAVPGQPIGVEPSFTRKDLVPTLMSTLVNAYIVLLRPLVHSNITFVDAEYWQMADVDSDPEWVFTHPIALAGTNATAPVASRQQTISFRTNEGGLGFNYLLELPSNLAADQRANFPSPSSGANALATYMIGTTSWVVGRDGGFYVTPVWWTTKTNDAIRKKMLDI